MLGFDGARTVPRAQSRPQSSSPRDRQKRKHWGREWALKGWGRHVATEWRVNTKKLTVFRFFTFLVIFQLNFNRSNWKLVFFQGLEQLRNRFTIMRRSSNAWSKDLPGCRPQAIMCPQRRPLNKCTSYHLPVLLKIEWLLTITNFAVEWAGLEKPIWISFSTSFSLWIRLKGKSNKFLSKNKTLTS